MPDGTGMKLPPTKPDNTHIGKLRPATVAAGKGGPQVRSGRTAPLKSGKK